MPISLKANSDGSSEILNGVVSALKINTDGSLEGTTIDGKLNKSENINLGVSVAASGTAVDFVGIPEGVKRITVMFDGVSTNGSSLIQIQIGTSGGLDTSGYSCTSLTAQATASNTKDYDTGFGMYDGSSATAIRNGVFSLSKNSGNLWFLHAVVGQTNDNRVIVSAGNKGLSGPLTTVRVTTVNGTDQFDAGTINIGWEF